MPYDFSSEARKNLPAKAPAALKKILDGFLDSVQKEDSALMSPESLALVAKTHLELSRERAPGKPAILIRTSETDKKKGTGKEQGPPARTVIDIVNDDMPFLVDSVAAEIARDYKLIHILLHPMLPVLRDEKKRFRDIAASASKADGVQSHIHVELHGALSPSVARQLEDSLRKVLEDVRHATRDWRLMREILQKTREALRAAPKGKYAAAEIEEYGEFLEYLGNDNFTLLGARFYTFKKEKGGASRQAVKGTGLGLLNDKARASYVKEIEDRLPQGAMPARGESSLLRVFKIGVRSTVHRMVPMDAVSVVQFDAKGALTGEYLFLGLFTSVTYSRSIRDVPLLRRKAVNVMARSGFAPGSHDYKALGHVLEKYPRDDLFQVGETDLLKICTSILHLQERQRIALYVRPDPVGGYVSCLVYVPRERYDTPLRMTIQTILEGEFQGVMENFHATLDDSPLARVMFIIYTAGKHPPSFDAKAIERRLQAAGKLWQEYLGEELLAASDTEEEALRFLRRYGEAFPAAYRENYAPRQAIFDMAKIEEALSCKTIALDLYQDKNCAADELSLKVFHAGQPLSLSAILPVLENMGLKAVSEKPFEIRPAGAEDTIWIQDFLLRKSGAIPARGLEETKERFEDAFKKIWAGEAENDGLNALVLSAGMAWRHILILRAYVRYMRQMGYSFDTRYIEQALTNNPDIAKKIAGAFTALFDPLAAPSRRAAKDCASVIEADLEKVRSLDEDRILRSIANLIDATLRTNFFQKGQEGAHKSWLSFKLESGKIKDLPRPVPYREIFVYSPRVEGVHLRGDVIARGGIRWSDRHEDFRTEVLGLMKAQQVKNAVIVPMGAKGGFIVKNPPAEGGRDAYLKEGIECYKTFIRGLLDITDNRQGTKVVKPKDVVCRDGDDPYLVVAADKGTATFSDTANAISIEYGHWLGDAFASGGSAGYDHKKMGITARGAWESIKRHFRELNHDTQRSAFDTIGVGDMGGDVFGNGMLLSQHIRLIGAFNHMHVFCDPDPDTAASFEERKRLFKAVKGWGDYNQELLSKGGRIYLRSEKSLALTPEIRARFDITAERVTPAELIQAMLRARTALLWFGGIGTYVKATHQTHADVGDKGNDVLRINASEIRASVIGEGANLALTQAARIECSRLGIKLNADFIDNSGGVDCSDHEVNIKILMAEIVAAGRHRMTRAARDKLLEGMTDEVATLVLRNNYQQTQAISLMEMQAARNLPVHARFIRDLERQHGLDRRIEGLPDEEEIERRLQAGAGLTRPELAIVQAYSKIMFSKDILKTDIPDQPVMQDYWLVDYFPEGLRKKYRPEILSHRLRREIIATTMATSLVNRMGPTFVKELMDKTGASCADVARAYLVVRDAFGLRGFWDMIEALDGKVPALVQLRAMQDIVAMMERETLWFLTRLGRKPDMEKDIETFGQGIALLQDNLHRIAPVALAVSIRQLADAGIADGLPGDLARRIALIPAMGAAFDIIRIAREEKADLVMAACAYFEIGEYFHIDWLRNQAQHIVSGGRWSGEALDGLVQELHACQAGLTAQVIRHMGRKITSIWKQGSYGIVEHWIENHCPQAATLDPLLTDIRNAGASDLAMIVTAAQRLRNLYGG